MNIRAMARCALFAALMGVCAWLSIPTPTGVFSLQTFGLFLTLAVLGGRGGSLTCLVYLLLGAVGVPVFTGFQGGLGVLLGPTGGFIVGFLAASLTYWLLTALKCKPLPALFLALAVCYLFGAIWYKVLFPHTGWGGVAVACILPYLIPDILKLALAAALSKKLKRFLA